MESIRYDQRFDTETMLFWTSRRYRSAGARTGWRWVARHDL